jgi:hypothetical protein
MQRIGQAWPDRDPEIGAVHTLPVTQRVVGVLEVAPAELIAGKVIAFQRRHGRPKSGTDWRDLAMLLLTLPELKSEMGAVRDRLEAAGVEAAMLETWHGLAAEEILPEDEDGDG